MSTSPFVLGMIDRGLHLIEHPAYDGIVDNGDEQSPLSC